MKRVSLVLAACALSAALFPATTRRARCRLA